MSCWPACWHRALLCKPPPRPRKVRESLWRPADPWQPLPSSSARLVPPGSDSAKDEVHTPGSAQESLGSVVRPVLRGSEKGPAPDFSVLGSACTAAALDSPDRVEQDRVGEVFPQDCVQMDPPERRPRLAQLLKSGSRAHQRVSAPWDELNKFEIVNGSTGVPRENDSFPAGLGWIVVLV